MHMYVEVVAKQLSPYPPESHKHNSKHLQALLDLWWGCPKEALISSQQSSKFGACGESRAATRPPCLGCSASRTVGPGNQRQLRMNQRSILIREHPLHFPLKGDWTFEPKLFCWSEIVRLFRQANLTLRMKQAVALGGTLCGNAESD